MIRGSFRKKTRNVTISIGRTILRNSRYYSKPRISRISKKSKDTSYLEPLNIRNKSTNPRIPNVSSTEELSMFQESQGFKESKDSKLSKDS
jgi:hypothetical protein